MVKSIDLNCDMGEGYGAYKLGYDDEVIQLISSVNIACGFHGGDPNVMDHTVEMAKRNGIGIGAHPGFPDLRGFGRRNMEIPREDLINDIVYQIGALEAFCNKHGVELQHIKPHGNMNNMTDEDEDMAKYIVEAVQSVKPDLPIYVKTNSNLHRAAENMGLPFVTEIFADRAYKNDLSLVSRREEGAVITEFQQAADRVVRMVTEGKVTAVTGEEVEVEGDSICVHGDTPSALEMIKTIREKLEKAGIEVKSPFQ